MEILIQSIRIIEREENKISKRELPEEFSIYIKQWVGFLYDNTAIQEYETRSVNTEVISSILDIIKNQADQKKFEEKMDLIARRLLLEERKAQQSVAAMSVVMKKGSLVQALLYDPETERYAFLLAKVEHTDFVDVSDYTFKSGFSKDKKNLWKSCIFMIDDLEADFYRATVYSDTAAKFWYDGFLELKPVNTDELNTERAFKAVEGALSRMVKKASPRDWSVLRNAAVLYFRTRDRIDYEEFISTTFEAYIPEELDCEKMQKVVETLKVLPEKHNFDRQFNITASKIKAKIKKVYKVYRGVELRITDALENIDETIQSERDKDGNRYIKNKTNDEMVYNTFLMKKKEEE